MDPIRTEGDIDQTFRQARRAAVINAWASLGLFDELVDGGPCRLEDLSGNPRSLRVTARILGHAGLLVRHGERWALSTRAEELHEDGVLGTGRSMQIFEDLAQLDEIVESGGPVPDDEGQKEGSKIGVHPEDPEATRNFLRMLYRRSAEKAREMARWVDELLDDEAHILDVGGGHGRYAREIARRGHRATLFDLPAAVDVARELHGDQLAYVEGDFFADDLGGPYDAAIASNIIHGLGPDQIAVLFGRVADALAPGGLFIIKDMVLDDLGMWPPSATYFALTMLMYTDRGDSYSMQQVHGWLAEAGLTPREPVVLEGHTLIVSAKNN
ncbi:MAG: class I SAM-dependent methyltransferase [Persicimonas sp.]